MIDNILNAIATFIFITFTMFVAVGIAMLIGKLIIKIIKSGYKLGVKDKEKKYSEEELISILYEQLEALDFYGSDFKFSDWFEKFRKK
jgi:hypothetical protein